LVGSDHSKKAFGNPKESQRLQFFMHQNAMDASGSVGFKQWLRQLIQHPTDPPAHGSLPEAMTPLPHNVSSGLERSPTSQA
jgi:hypothetical protein